MDALGALGLGEPSVPSLDGGGAGSSMFGDISSRLDALENAAKTAAAQQQHKGFMDKYGMMFSGDEGIGTTILAEMNRQGVDTSAAEEAVMQIMNDLAEGVVDVMNRVEVVRKAVEKALGKEADPIMADTEPPPPVSEIPETAPAPTPEAAPPAPAPEQSPPATGAAPAGGAPPAAAAPAAPAPAAAPAPDMSIPSDKHLKVILEKGANMGSAQEVLDLVKSLMGDSSALEETPVPEEEQTPDTAEVAAGTDAGVDDGKGIVGEMPQEFWDSQKGSNPDSLGDEDLSDPVLDGIPMTEEEESDELYDFPESDHALTSTPYEISEDELSDLDGYITNLLSRTSKSVRNTPTFDKE